MRCPSLLKPVLILDAMKQTVSLSGMGRNALNGLSDRSFGSRVERNGALKQNEDYRIKSKTGWRASPTMQCGRIKYPDSTQGLYFSNGIWGKEYEHKLLSIEEDAASNGGVGPPHSMFVAQTFRWSHRNLATECETEWATFLYLECGRVPPITPWAGRMFIHTLSPLITRVSVRSMLPSSSAHRRNIDTVCLCKLDCARDETLWVIRYIK